MGENRSSLEGRTIIIGIIIMLLGILCFAGNDAMGKGLVATFAVGQVLLLRSVGAFFVLIPMVARHSPRDLLTPPKPRLQVARTLAATADTGLFYAAVMYLPLTNVMTFYMAGPIYVAVISHFFLGEKMRWKRWFAIFVGFIGVVIALNPSPDKILTWPSLFALVGSLGFALVIIFNRVLRETREATLVTWQVGGALVIGAIICLVEFFHGQWVTPNLNQWIALLLLGIVSTIAHILVARSLKMAPASVLAPLQYTMLLWAIIFDYVFFGIHPDARVLTGAAVIVVAGIFIFHRKKVVTDRVPKSDASHIGR